MYIYIHTHPHMLLVLPPWRALTGRETIPLTTAMLGREEELTPANLKALGVKGRQRS